ncbi:MAG: methyl-accepting chemotaxis protein [Spirochaetia bacterium]|nr:methyl-accepting chemotaxis protein [Spirochaetia bacterium]
MEEQEPKHSTRWRYYIDKQFQNQFIVRFSLVIILVALFTLGTVLLLRENAYQIVPGNFGVVIGTDAHKVISCRTPEGTTLDLPIPKKYFNAFELYAPAIVFISAVNLVLIVVFSLFYSHSMAGPIHNIKNVLEELAAGGKARPIRVRKGDQFQDLVDLLNEVIEKRVK